eukprot:m.224816 g.224816  ORF g.224816 m.224816 type:complete len:1637 (+) comp17300_c1_seq2:64-4974(+)
MEASFSDAALSATRKRVADNGTITIFLSSPFVTMERERTLFVETYMPLLRSMCEPKGIFLKAVDLRWGITKEQADQNETLRICLDELGESDIFIGFFGRRYGSCYNPRDANTDWVKANFDQCQNEHPWVTDYLDKAVTEVEFRHGFLNNPNKRPCLLAFRDHAYDQVMYDNEVDPRTKRKFVCPSMEQLEKLEDLQDRCEQVVRSSQNDPSTCLAYTTYAEPDKGAQYMYTFVRKLLRHILPASKVTTTAFNSHRAFGLARTRVFQGRATAITVLNDFVRKSTSATPLLLSGEAGCGKSATLAHWMRSTDMKGSKAIYHHLGCDNRSTALADILLNLAAQLGLRCDASFDPKDVYTSLLKVLGTYDPAAPSPQPTPKRASLSQVADEAKMDSSNDNVSDNAASRLVIILDGLERLDDNLHPWLPGHRVRSLAWLNKLQQVPGVAVCIATNEDGQVELLRSHGCQELTLGPLSVAEQHAIAQATMDLASKTLAPELRDTLLENPLTTNALFLELALQELVKFGRFSTLPGKIAELKACHSLSALITAILNRVENTFAHVTQSNGRSVIANALALIGTAQEGLQPDVELRQLLGLDDKVHSLTWSQVYFGLKPLLTLRKGCVTFLHQAVAAAVRVRHLSGASDRKYYHQLLAAFFLGYHADGFVSPTSEPSHPLAKILNQQHANLLQTSLDLGELDTVTRAAHVRATAQGTAQLPITAGNVPARRLLIELPAHLLALECWDALQRMLTSASWLHVMVGGELTSEALIALQQLHRHRGNRHVTAVLRTLQANLQALLQNETTMLQVASNLPTAHMLHRSVTKVLDSLVDKNMPQDGDAYLYPTLFDWCNKRARMDPCRASLQAHEGPIHNCTLAEDGRTALSASGDGRLILWDCERQQETLVMTGHEGKVAACALAPGSTSTWALSGGKDRTVRLWELTSGKNKVLLRWPSGGITACQVCQLVDPIAPDFQPSLRRTDTLPSSRLGIASPDTMSSPASKLNLSMSATLASLSESPTASQRLETDDDEADSEVPTVAVIGTGDKRVLVLELPSGEIIHNLDGHRGSIRDVITVQALGLAVSCDAVSIRLWDLRTGARAGELQQLQNVAAIAACLQSDTEPCLTLAAASGKKVIVYRCQQLSDSQWKLLPLHVTNELTHTLRCVALCEGGSMLLAGADDATVHAWHTSDCSPAEVYSGHTKSVACLSVAATGSVFLSGSRDRSLRLYDASFKLQSSQDTEPSQPSFYPQTWHSAPVLSMGFQGSSLFTTSADGLAKRWSGPHLETVDTYRGHSNWLTCSALSQDGKYGLVGCHDTTLSILDLASLQRVSSIRGHTESVTKCAINSSGALVLSCSSREQCVKLWQGPFYPTWLTQQDAAMQAALSSSTSSHPDCLWTMSLPSAARACGFVERLGIVVVGDGVGNVHAVPLSAMRSAQIVFNQHSAAVACLSVVADETTLLIGYVDGLTVAMEIPPAWSPTLPSKDLKPNDELMPPPNGTPTDVDLASKSHTPQIRPLKRGASLRDSARKVMLLNRWAAAAGVTSEQLVPKGHWRVRWQAHVADEVVGVTEVPDASMCVTFFARGSMALRSLDSGQSLAHLRASSHGLHCGAARLTEDGHVLIATGDSKGEVMVLRGVSASMK